MAETTLQPCSLGHCSAALHLPLACARDAMDDEAAFIAACDAYESQHIARFGPPITSERNEEEEADPPRKKRQRFTPIVECATGSAVPAPPHMHQQRMIPRLRTR